MRRTMMLVAGAALALLVAGRVALAASINCPNTPNGFCYGTNVGDSMYGDFRVDRMYEGNEAGWGDKLLGQRGEDGMWGNRVDDALYGGNGDDVVEGGRGDDLIQGGYGNDAIYTGFDDQVNAQDGQKDIITCGSGNDLIYLDFKLDVLRDCGTTRANLSKLSPPEDLFAHPGKVPVDHEGEERCLPEEDLEAHLEHGNEIINPSGYSDAKEGRK